MSEDQHIGGERIPSPRRGEGQGEEVMGALCRAAAYRLIAAGYAFPNGNPLPIEEAIVAFMEAGVPELAKRALELKRELEILSGSLTDHYAGLFGFATGGDLSLYETEHVGVEVFRKSRDLADIAGFYRAFGLETNPDERERVDHLSAEAEFLAWLCVKQSVALSEGSDEKAAVCRDAEVRFLKDHFLRWVPGLAKKIEESSGGFYQVLARFTGLWLDRLIVQCNETSDGFGPSVIPVKTGIQTGCPPSRA